MPKCIVVKGTSGAGKTTFGRSLAGHLKLPFVELDSLHHGPNWTAASACELRARLSVRLDDDYGWVVDGNYDDKLGTFLTDRADLIVWLDLPLGTKLCRLVARTTRRWFTGETLWNGNRETLKGVFGERDGLFPWALQSHFHHRRVWPEKFAQHRVIRLRTPAQVQACLGELSSGSCHDHTLAADLPECRHGGGTRASDGASAP